MSSNDLHFHYVSTHQEAEELIDQHDRFWVSNCGCREGHGGCGRSRMDVCLQFSEDSAGSGSGKRSISKPEVMAILQEAKAKDLVARPFRKGDDFTVTDGVCFCCDDCCSYFLNPTEICDRGALIEQTDLEACTHCGACEPVCRFGARTMVDDQLAVDRDRCYGCGLCVAACAVECVEMIPRG